MNSLQILGKPVDLWMVFGLIGQLLFGCRFLIQWIASEIKKESHIPIVFWYLSLSGGCALLIYAIHIQDPIFILGQFGGAIVYTRNLTLIKRKRKRQKLLNNES